jgi:hypothetical protein
MTPTTFYSSSNMKGDFIKKKIKKNGMEWIPTKVETQHKSIAPISTWWESQRGGKTYYMTLFLKLFLILWNTGALFL